MGTSTGVKRYTDTLLEYRIKIHRKALDGKISQEKYERLIEKTYEWEERNDEQTD